MITSCFFLRLFQLKMVKEIIQEDAMYEDKFQVKQLHHIWCRPLEASKETYHMSVERFISWRQRTHQTSSTVFLNLRLRLNRMDWLAVLGATGPTTLPLLCVPLRMNSVCRLQWVFGTQQGCSSDGSVENFKRRRATEIKHGRISMLATMGYITPELTGKFPGFLSPSAGLKFADVPNGLAAISQSASSRLGSDRGIHGLLRSFPRPVPWNRSLCWRLWMEAHHIGWPRGEENQA